MITTVTLNPMLDKTITLESLTRGTIQRASRVEAVPGGKGINVSRQLHRLGIETVATGFLGGQIGRIISGLIGSEGYGQDFVWTGGMTREGLTFVEKDGSCTSVFEPSQPVTVGEVHDLSHKVSSLAGRSRWIVCSGSSPGGDADDLFYEAILAAHKAGIPSVLDSYGRAFTLALQARPALVKPNKAELEQSTGLRLNSEAEILRSLRSMVSDGVEYCVLTDGSHPVYAASGNGAWKITPPEIKAVNPVGSGDSMVAGMLFGFLKGWDFEQCLRFGAAAGTANACVWAVAHSSYDDIKSFEPQVKIQRL